MAGKTGVWIIGALGNVGLSTIAGARAVARGLASGAGLVSRLPEFRSLPLAPLEDLVFGGHEIRNSDLYTEALQYHRENGVPSRDVVEGVKSDLQAISADVRPGILVNCGRPVARMANGRLPKKPVPLAESIRSIQNDIRSFARRRSLSDVVVLNLASCEASVDSPALGSLEAFEAALKRDRREEFTSSVLYAYAALEAGYPYVNFTPSHGSSVPALSELALARGLPHVGKDAKTGETLLKTTLAPMFYMRNLDVLSWEGHNILGNRDGLVLDDPENAKLKLADKKEVLQSILKNPKLHTRVRIDYVESLRDWKTAWNFIHFEGFLGAKMSLQLIWQGCDSLLAAPLALDLARFAELGHRTGLKGPMTHLACFFKNPLGVRDHNMFTQFRRLVRYATSFRAAPARA